MSSEHTNCLYNVTLCPPSSESWAERWLDLSCSNTWSITQIHCLCSLWYLARKWTHAVGMSTCRFSLYNTCFSFHNTVLFVYCVEMTRKIVWVCCSEIYFCVTWSPVLDHMIFCIGSLDVLDHLMYWITWSVGAHDLLYWITWSSVLDRMIFCIGSHDLHWIAWSLYAVKAKPLPPEESSECDTEDEIQR